MGLNSIHSIHAIMRTCDYVVEYMYSVANTLYDSVFTPKVKVECECPEEVQEACKQYSLRKRKPVRYTEESESEPEPESTS